MDHCHSCNKTFTYWEAYKGYINFWTIRCPQCSTRSPAPFTSRLQVMVATLIFPFVLWYLLTESIMDDPSFPLKLGLLVIMLILFTLGAPFMVRFSRH